MLRARAGRVIDEHDAVFRFNNAPTRRFEEHVGSRVTYHLVNRAAADSLLEKPVVADAKNPRVRKFRAPLLLWRAESFSYFPLLVKKYPDDQLALVSPELLVKTIYNYKFAMKRMDAANVSVDAAQVAPGGLVGVTLALQVCDRVTLWGFDPFNARAREKKLRYHYFDKAEPYDPRSTDVEMNVLRLMAAGGLVRLCDAGAAERCVREWDAEVQERETAEEAARDDGGSNRGESAVEEGDDEGGGSGGGGGGSGSGGGGGERKLIKGGGGGATTSRKNVGKSAAPVRE